MIKKLIWLIIAASFTLFLFINIPSPTKIQGDGVFYYSWAHSAIFDQDIDFRNQLQYFSQYDFYSNKFISENIETQTGMTPNPYAFGTAILWAPFIAIAHLASLVVNAIFSREIFLADGFSALYFFAVNLASWIFGTVSLVLNFKTLKYYFSDKISLISTGLFWLGTPWIYYQFFEPSMSHMASLLCISVFFHLVVKELRGGSYQPFLLFLSALMATSVRWQNALSFLIFIIVFSRKNSGWKLVSSRNLLVLAALFLVGLLQITIWKVLYGNFFIIPQGEDFILSDFHGIATLFSSNRGLLFWSPIFILSFVGMIFWNKSKKVFLLAIGVFISQWLVNSALSDPGGGDAFGARRFIETIPFLILFFAEAINYLQRKKIIIFAWALTSWSILLLIGYHYDIIPRSGEFRVFEILKNMF
jgi:hypothetical protein